MNIPRGDDLAKQVRRQFPSQTPTEIACLYQIKIVQENLPLHYLAEATLTPPVITINAQALKILSEASIAENYQAYFSVAILQEVLVAHELYHILTNQPSHSSVETQAHAFAQNLLGLPFDPQMYEKILRRSFAQ